MKSLLAFALVALVLGCNSPSQDMKNEVKVGAPTLNPAAGVRDPSVKPVARTGIPDDGIKPVAKTGIPDDSVKPLKPITRTGVPDDSVKPFKPGVPDDSVKPLPKK